MNEYLAIAAAFLPPGAAVGAATYLYRKVTVHDTVLVAQAARLVRIEGQVDKLVDHLITKA